MEYNRRKYHNVPDNRTAPGGRHIRFDSKKEAARYDELMLLLKAKRIKNLRLQPEYTLMEAFTTPEGERIKAIRYKADSAYEKAVGDEVITVVEDVKSEGTKTQQYLLKRKLMQEKGIKITEV
jgi:hypothetical protein